MDETIVAIASPPGGAAMGIVRLSGPDLRSCLEGCFRPDPFVHLPSLTQPTAVPGCLWLAGFASPLPCTLYLWPGKRSYTGQPVAEVHTFGSPPLLEAVVRAACSGGARPAEPGEFTLRAFLAGRIDLTQAEAVLGVIDATGSAELDAALKQLAGGLAGPLRLLRDDLLELLAHLEAGFDFADEDLPFITSEELLRQLDAATAQVDQLVKRLALRSEAAVRVRVALVGRPNTGKSSLFNAMAGHTGAMVSDQPGTTRDYLTADLDLDGLKCQLIDTAGIEDRLLESDAATVEGAAQDMSHEQLRTAHIRVLCLEAGRELDAWERETIQDRISVARKVAGTLRVPSDPRSASGQNTTVVDATIPSEPNLIVVLTKCDRGEFSPNHAGSILETSAVTGLGIHKLKEAIRSAAVRAGGPQTDVVVGTAVRCSESLRLSAASLDHAREAVRGGLGEELIAIEVRVALSQLGKVAGAVYTEDVLDRIFSRFCIGK
ncbi:MAG: GTPase [Planctomycetota bacterium]